MFLLQPRCPLVPCPLVFEGTNSVYVDSSQLLLLFSCPSARSHAFAYVNLSLFYKHSNRTPPTDDRHPPLDTTMLTTLLTTTSTRTTPTGLSMPRSNLSTMKTTSTGSPSGSSSPRAPLAICSGSTKTFTTSTLHSWKSSQSNQGELETSPGSCPSCPSLYRLSRILSRRRGVKIWMGMCKTCASCPHGSRSIHSSISCLQSRTEIQKHHQADHLGNKKDGLLHHQDDQRPRTGSLHRLHLGTRTVLHPQQDPVPCLRHGHKRATVATTTTHPRTVHRPVCGHRPRLRHLQEQEVRMERVKR